MQQLPHNINTFHSKKIQNLVNSYGIQIYGIYWAIKEIIAKSEDEFVSMPFESLKQSTGCGKWGNSNFEEILSALVINDLIGITFSMNCSAAVGINYEGVIVRMSNLEEKEQ